MNNPAIVADLGKLKQNAQAVLAHCKKYGVSLAAVTKVFCADAPLVAALDACGPDFFADSRLENLERIDTDKPRLLLRIADSGQADAVVRLAQYSLQSEAAAIRALGAAAQAQQKRHQVILMIDLGDLREGLYVEDETAILRAAQAVVDQPWLALAGVGTNLTCFGGIIPDRQNLGRLCAVARQLRQTSGLPVPIVSGGNSSSLSMLFAGALPEGVNNLRIGEGLLLGRDTAIGQPFAFLHQDVFTLRARLVEVQIKPSHPVGQTGPNAFGEEVRFADEGLMRRGILAVGRQDTDAEGLTPRDARIRILGASSDHLLVDLTRANDIGLGDTLSFGVSYGALLRAYTSAYIKREYC